MIADLYRWILVEVIVIIDHKNSISILNLRSQSNDHLMISRSLESKGDYSKSATHRNESQFLKSRIPKNIFIA